MLVTETVAFTTDLQSGAPLDRLGFYLQRGTGGDQPATLTREASLGAHLVRMEARVALAELVNRIRRCEVDEDAAVRVHSRNVLRFAHLPVMVEAA
jgi:hypothetical protein